MTEEQELAIYNQTSPIYHICNICGVQVHHDYWELHTNYHNAAVLDDQETQELLDRVQKASDKLRWNLREE